MFVVGFQDTGILLLDRKYTVFDLDDFSMEDVSGLDLIKYYDLLCDKYEFLNLASNKKYARYYISHWQLSEILIRRASVLDLKCFSLFQQSFNKLFIILNNDYLCFSCDKNCNICINDDKIAEDIGICSTAGIYIELRYILYEDGYIVFHFNFYEDTDILESDFKLYYKDNKFILNNKVLTLKKNFSKKYLLGDL